MKVGVVTGLDNKNYGNRLQNYAVNRILQNIGIETINIYAYIQENTIQAKYGKKETLKKLLPLRVRYFLQRFRTYQMNTWYGFCRVIRFMKVTKKYMPVHMYYVKNYSQLQQKIEDEKIDMFFVGSDQVWNPNFAGTPFYFLSFVPKEKRASFIASIGVEKIPEEKREDYKNWLQQMSYISVREQSAKDIVKQLTGKEVDCFLDPTLLLPRDEWTRIEKKPHYKLPSRYIFTFFFGKDYQDDVKKIANEKGIEIVSLNDKANAKYYYLNPMEFLYVLHHAELVLTDSFHVVAFSIKYRKQFYVYQREQFPEMFTRIVSMLTLLNMTEQIRCLDSKFDDNKISDESFNYAETVMQEQYQQLINRLKNLVSNNIEIRD